MAGQEPLFQQGDLRSALEGQAQALEREVQQVPEDHLLHVDEDEWIEALVSRYSVEPPELHADQWEMDEPQEIQVDVSYDHMRRAIIDPSRPVYISGYRVVVHIPFTGEADVLSSGRAVSTGARPRPRSVDRKSGTRSSTRTTRPPTSSERRTRSSGRSSST